MSLNFMLSPDLRLYLNLVYRLGEDGIEDIVEKLNKGIFNHKQIARDAGLSESTFSRFFNNCTLGARVIHPDLLTIQKQIKEARKDRIDEECRDAARIFVLAGKENPQEAQD